MQCILRTSNPDTMEVRALSLVLLCTFVTVIFGLPTLPEPAVNAHEERTLSTELQPPAPSLDEKEEYSTIYIINLYAVKNSSSNVSEEMFQNEVVETLPDIIEPLVSVILVVEDNENEESENHRPVDLDKFAEGLEDEGFKVDKIDFKSKTKVLKMKLEKAEAQSMIDSALKGDQKKFRQKRSYCMRCGRYGGHGGYSSEHYSGDGSGGGWDRHSNGGGYPSGGGHYPGDGSKGQQGYTAVIPVVLVPVSTGHYGHGGHHGGHRGRGGCCGGGGGGYGGGGAYASAQASAQAGSWPVQN
ncbi:hypothetical protein G5I_04951 [Acromyrmex echinatior]|uniref:Uncharacterized protein n=1 Tax=Acromyrmex echinatior TaxID=103372 RepID=F4WGZ9_ACREC|nr:hypothetical protein G5I_04951 [Acromyrmex echinatior]